MGASFSSSSLRMVTFCSAACPIVLMYRAPYTVQAGVTFFLVHFGISFGLVYKNNYSEIPFPLEALQKAVSKLLGIPPSAV